MKFFTAKIFSLLLLLCAAVPSIKADHYYEDGRDCCPSACYECGCNPLYCGAWDLQVHGGVAPILWRQRDDFAVINCALIPASPFEVLFEVPKFRHFFKIPWTVGGQVGYHLSDNTRIYLEFNYVQARGKNDADLVAVNATPVETHRFNFRKYKLFDGYVGLRYYFDRWCDRTSFFFGGKIGFTHHKRLTFSDTIVDPLPVVAVFPEGTEVFGKSTSFSGGAHIGLDFCFCGNFSFVLTAEVVGSCGPHAVAPLVIPTGLGLAATQLIVGSIGSELRFPITAGIRYSF